jgi:hypothetical protein
VSLTDRLRLQALVTPWYVLALIGGTTLLVLALFGKDDPGVMTSRLRLAGIAVAASAAFFFDDPAAPTVASSPASLLVRRWHRFVYLAAGATTWWIAATLLVRFRNDVTVPGRLALELLATTAVAVGVSLTVSRWAHTDAPGAVGAVVAPAWVALGHVPRPEWLPLPPAPGADASLYIGVAVVAVAVALVASRDACSRIARARRPDSGAR